MMESGAAAHVNVARAPSTPVAAPGRCMARYPYWSRARDNTTLPEYRADQLTVESFAAMVRKNAPCVVRGAVDAWPARQRWSLEALAERCDLDGDDGYVYDEPNPREWGHLWTPAPARPPMSRRPRDFFESSAPRVMRIGLSKIRGDGRADLNQFAFPFLASSKASAKAAYGDSTVYLYKGGSFTDWHAHLGYEAMMCQVRGAKDVLLLPPTIDVWRALTPALDGYDHSYDIPAGAFPLHDALEPVRVTVHPGDALYIPAWWWHVVEAVDGDFGCTVPTWWPSPMRVRLNPRVPQADHTVWRVLPNSIFSRDAWKAKDRGATLARALMLGALFLTPLPWISTALSGSRFGARPRLRGAS